MTSPGLPSTASFPPIVEKVEEEERAAQETARCPPSPLAHYYSSLTLCDRYAWPAFLGDWAFVDGSGQPRRGNHRLSSFRFIIPKLFLKKLTPA